MTQTLLSANQTHPLHHTFFVPKGDIKTSLLIVHGMSEHSGRYADFAQFLADNGVLVLTFDLLGHGKTAKDEDELGFFDEKYPVQTLSKDVMMMADALNQKAKKLTTQAVPCFIMGHSMGSLLVRCVLTHHGKYFDGVILMGTGAGVPFFAKTLKKALMLLNWSSPTVRNEHLGAVVNRYLWLRSPKTKINSNFAWLSDNEDSIRQFEQDPSLGFCFTNNGYYTLFTLAQKAEGDWYQHLQAPVLLASGDKDPVGGNGRDVKHLHKRLSQAGVDVELKLYANMRHEPLQEKQRQVVYDDILAFIRAKT